MVDIEDMDEEQLVQEVINQKIANQPLSRDDSESISYNTDDMTPQKEAELQTKIDSQKQTKKEKLVGSKRMTRLPNGTYCDECQTKSPYFHKKGCSKRK